MKKSKILFLFGVTIGVFLITVSNVNAWFTPNKTSFALSGVYSDGLNTSEDANNAHNAYSSMGLSYMKKITSPTISAVKGSHSNGTAYLNSGIVFMSGHGNKDLMAFNKSGGTEFYIQANTTTVGNYIGIGNYVNASNALIVFAGCETAKGSSNISSYVVNKGAKISIGWTTSVNAGSHTNWLKRFNNKIKDKSTTVANAKRSADGYIYLDSRVKNGKIYGSSGYNPWYFMSGGSKSQTISNISSKHEYISNEYFVTKYNNNEILSKESNVLNIVENFIVENIDSSFDKSDYILEVNGVDTKYYDYIMYVDGIRTNFGYSIAVDKDGTVRLYDNTNSKTSASLKQNLTSNNTLSKKFKVYDFDQQVTDDYHDCKITPYMKTNYYDVTDEKLYQVAIYDIEFSNGILTSVEYKEEL